jgi:hypothetical protein
MAGEVSREEFDARVGVLEREVEGEKMVTRHILEQTRRNGDDLATMRTEVSGLRGEVSGLRGEVSGLRGEVSGLRSELVGLRGMVTNLVNNLPRTIGDAMREILRERDQK